MKIGWITDIHLGMNGDLSLFNDFEAYLDFACRRYDYVVITGDIVHRGGNEEFHDHMKYVADLINNHGGSDKIRLIPGNHDSRALIERPDGSKAQHFNESAWAIYFPEGFTDPVEHDNLRLAFADFNILTAEEERGGVPSCEEEYRLRERDLEMLAGEVAALEPGQQLKLFTHIPLCFAEYPDIGYSNGALAHQILQAVDRSIEVMSGHWHCQYHERHKGFTQIVFPPFFRRQEALASQIGRCNAVIRAEHGRMEMELRKGFPRP